MSSDNRNGYDGSNDLDEYYEEIASQEEIYLEEAEEEVRAILIFEDTAPSEIGACILPLDEDRQNLDLASEKASDEAKDNTE
ncbi:MAG TPA: hypothetical protein VN577_18325 [Terriglobales bacterium]|nr:hypothetical protein [Terriglobales bacterium]